VEDRAQLVTTIRWQGAAFAGWGAQGSPFYAGLCEELALDAERDGPVTRVIAPYGDASFQAAYVLRLLGGLHRLVLSGAAPALAQHYPSVGGDGDARAAMALLRETLADPPAVVVDALRRPPQTNEVGRAAALTSGLLVVADAVGLPLRLREIGASGGLNLRPDLYWYEHDGHAWGNRSSTVRFVDLWHGGLPPFEAGVDIADRRGCDQDPIDLGSRDDALRLLSYIWPEPAERFERARHAIDLARSVPVVVDRADASAWLREQLATPEAGTALVVYHSVVWQYLDEQTRAALTAQLREAGAGATREAPLAWLRLEPHPETYAPAELRLTLWDGRSGAPREVLLATTGFHGGAIDWFPGPEPSER
jgi:hypothetical protein